MERTVTIEKVIVKDFNTHNHSYAICRDNEGCYWGFDKADFNENGECIKGYNGISGHHSKNIVDTMRMCYQSARSENEIDRAKLNANDTEELKKLFAIIEDSYREIA